MSFLNNYYHDHHMAGLVQHTAYDFLYVPQVLAEDYVTFAHLFMADGVFIELAVPALLYGVASRSQMRTVRGSSLWGDSRAAPQSFYGPSDFFVHPFKFYGHLKNKASRDFFCGVYLNTLLSELAKGG